MSETKTSILKIIESVRKRHCIWDTNSADYNKRNKVEIAWKEVSKEIGCSENYCKDKWKNVRTGFLRSIKDVPPNGMTLCKRKPFYLHDEMKFLLAQLKRNEQKEISEDVSSDEEKDFSLSIDDSITFDDKNIPLIEMSPAANEIAHGPNEMSYAVSEIKNDINNMTSIVGSSEVPRRHKRPKEDVDKILLKCLTKRRKKSPEETAWLSLFKGLMPDILSLSGQKQRQLKKKFVDFVYDMHESE